MDFLFGFIIGVVGGPLIWEVLKWVYEKITNRRNHVETIQPATVVWLTGLSGSGKSTIASTLEQKIKSLGCPVCNLDGDILRKGLNSDLSFSEEDRKENIRRVAYVAKLLSDLGIITICGFISPYKDSRDFVRSVIGSKFVEVYVKCPIEECERRDPKGLYAKQRSGQMKGLTGIESPYEPPTSPELVLPTDKVDVDVCVNLIMEIIKWTEHPRLK
jgi:adenylylsulfate kinase